MPEQSARHLRQLPTDQDLQLNLISSEPAVLIPASSHEFTDRAWAVRFEASVVHRPQARRRAFRPGWQ